MCLDRAKPIIYVYATITAGYNINKLFSDEINCVHDDDLVRLIHRMIVRTVSAFLTKHEHLLAESVFSVEDVSIITSEIIYQLFETVVMPNMTRDALFELQEKIVELLNDNDR